MANRFIVIVETDVEPEGVLKGRAVTSRIEVERRFDGADFTIPDCLRAVEDALRGASFLVPEGSLTVGTPREAPVPDQRFKA